MLREQFGIRFSGVLPNTTQFLWYIIITAFHVLPIFFLCYWLLVIDKDKEVVKKNKQEVETT
jgi:hypothetical protein